MLIKPISSESDRDGFGHPALFYQADLLELINLDHSPSHNPYELDLPWLRYRINPVVNQNASAAAPKENHWKA